MTKTFSVNAQNDLYIDTNGNMATVSDVQAVSQACVQACKTQLGEMVLSINEGIPNFQTIWVGSPNIPQFEAALRSTILSVPDVTDITSLSTQLESGNVISYEVFINTIYGSGIIRGTFNG